MPVSFDLFATKVIAASVVASVPLVLAGMGEQMSQKTRILNIGLEGMMLAGAYAGFLVSNHFGTMWPGFLAGILAGVAVAAPMVLLCVLLGLDQIVVGISLTLAVQGATSLLHHFSFGRSYPRLQAADAIALPLISQIPIIGAAIFSQHPLVYVAVAACCVLSWLYRHTFFGLYLIAAGSAPDSLDFVGVRVNSVRSVAVFSTGAFAGLAGAYLSEVGAGIFVPFMTNGLGFIAIVLAMLARGSPFLVLGWALLFGASLSAATALQVLGTDIPTDVVQMLPFGMTMLALIIFGNRNGLPLSLGGPFRYPR